MIWASPALGAYSPHNILKVVVLPAPFTPNNPKPILWKYKIIYAII